MRRCVSPVVVVPGNWTDKELDDKAQDVVSGVVNNASFNCLAVKCVVVARGWALRDKFLARIEHHLQVLLKMLCRALRSLVNWKGVGRLQIPNHPW